MSSVLVLNVPYLCPLSSVIVFCPCLLSLSSVLIPYQCPLSLFPIIVSRWLYFVQGTERSCVCVSAPKECACVIRCTVGVYSTEESRYLYSLGEYICLLFTLKKFSIHLIYFYIFQQTLQAKFSCNEYNLIKVYIKTIRYSSLIIIDDIVLQFHWL